MNLGYDTVDFVFFLLIFSISYTNNQWSKGYQLFMNNMTHMRIVSLVNIKGTTSPLPHLEPKNILK